MSIFSILAAFGGGTFGAAFGALPSFILTGLIAIAGGILALSGAADYSMAYIAFGPFLGPHVAFAGGVAAAAFAAHKRKKLKNGADILTSLYGLGDGSVLLVGGVFGVLGSLVAYLWGTVVGIPTDQPGITVLTLGIATRLLFGKCGILGKCECDEMRVWFPNGEQILNTIVLSVGLGIVITGTGELLLLSGVEPGTLAGSYPVLCFGISAFSLFFVQTGSAAPTTHHITFPCALAFCLSGNMLIGMVTALVCGLLCELAVKLFNSYCDTHIDPPATTITIVVLLINLLLG